MSPPSIDIPEDEDYASSQDSDFAPDAQPKIDLSDLSDSEPETTKLGERSSTSKRIKRKRSAGEGDDGEEAVGFENSGDEGLIREGKKALKRRRKKGEDSDDGGEGGLVKTRSQRALEKVEKKPLANVEAATVDVDALWASMISGNPSRPPAHGDAADKAKSSSSGGEVKTHQTLENPISGDSSDMITIHRSYNFAGKVHIEEKTIPRDSAEAILYLESHPSSSTSQTQAKPFPKKLPTTKLRKSMFEPIMDPLFPPRTDLHFGSNRTQGEKLMREALASREREREAKKLNTVEKSKMDWAGFVDKEGIRDELVRAGRAKGNFIGRREFLGRVESTKDDEARKARMGV